MKKIFFILLISIAFVPTINAQNALEDIRKLVLKSDAIFTSFGYVDTIIAKNDFTKEHYVIFEKIDTVLKNKANFLSKNNKKIRILEDGEDYFSALQTNAGGCVQGDVTVADNIGHTSLFFVKKNGKTWEALAVFSYITIFTANYYTNQIAQIASIENASNLSQRYQRTLDWYINTGKMPGDDLTAYYSYYKQQGIIKDSIVYTDIQQKNALDKFLTGYEELLPIIKTKYKTAIKNYFINKLQTIASKKELDYSDYYEFNKTIHKMANNFENDFDNINYLLVNQLTEEKMDKYDKIKIMNHLIEFAKELP